MVRLGSAALAAIVILAASNTSRGDDVAFTVINDSSYDLVAFYTTPADATGWGHNLLGGYKLRSQSQGTATISGGAEKCVYDLKYALSDGETYYKRDVDICRISSYRIED